MAGLGATCRALHEVQREYVQAEIANALKEKDDEIARLRADVKRLQEEKQARDHKMVRSEVMVRGMMVFRDRDHEPTPNDIDRLRYIARNEANRLVPEREEISVERREWALREEIITLDQLEAEFLDQEEIDYFEAGGSV